MARYGQWIERTEPLAIVGPRLSTSWLGRLGASSWWHSAPPGQEYPERGQAWPITMRAAPRLVWNIGGTGEREDAYSFTAYESQDEPGEFYTSADQQWIARKSALNFDADDPQFTKIIFNDEFWNAWDEARAKGAISYEFEQPYQHHVGWDVAITCYESYSVDAGSYVNALRAMPKTLMVSTDPNALPPLEVSTNVITNPNQVIDRFYETEGAVGGFSTHFAGLRELAMDSGVQVTAFINFAALHENAAWFPNVRRAGHYGVVTYVTRHFGARHIIPGRFRFIYPGSPTLRQIQRPSSARQIQKPSSARQIQRVR